MQIHPLNSTSARFYRQALVKQKSAVATFMNKIICWDAFSLIRHFNIDVPNYNVMQKSLSVTVHVARLNSVNTTVNFGLSLFSVINTCTMELVLREIFWL
jgi:hypothetical protein